jgi:predicted lipid-binding transport protein (Tim44 family)
VLGELIGHSAHVAFGFTGATLLLLLLFGLGFSLFFHVSWMAVAERIGGGIENAIDWFVQRYQYREDRRQGEVAAVKREEVVVHERAKHVEKHPVAAPHQGRAAGDHGGQVRARREGAPGQPVHRPAARAATRRCRRCRCWMKRPKCRKPCPSKRWNSPAA